LDGFFEMGNDNCGICFMLIILGLFGIELDFPKPRLKLLECYFVFNRCVDFDLVAQMGGGFV